MWKRLSILVVVAAFLGSFAVPVHGQQALIQAALQNFVRLNHTWTGTQTFTTVVYTTLQTPIVSGGTGVTSTLTLQPTTGAGTTGADIIFKVGNNGTTEVGRVTNAGAFTVGTGTGQFAVVGNELQLAQKTVNGANIYVGGTGSTAPTIQFLSSNEDTAADLVARKYKGFTQAIILAGTGTGASQVDVNQTTPPTCSSSCGTSPAVVGSDSSGVVTMGASGVPASGFVITFNGTWALAPSCIVQSALTSMVVGKQPIAVQVSTTTITVTTNGTAPSTSDKYAYVCIGVQ